MATRNHFALHRAKRSQAGQTMILVVLALGIFLIALVAFAVDYSNVWFHRQSAQSAADAACTAAVMDMLYATSNFAITGPGALTDCASTPDAAPCKYAAMNGYNGTGLVTDSASNAVSITFPDSNAGVGPCTGTPTPSVCEATGVVDNAYVRATVTDRTPLFFAKMISGSPTVDVGAVANCGLVMANAPIPILILNPTATGTFAANGTGSVTKITITGGPRLSIQVNSKNGAAASVSGSPTVDLSKAGPGTSGGLFSVTGGPGGSPVTLLPSNSNYVHDSPISDPFARLAAPGKPVDPPVPSDVDTSLCKAADIPKGKCLVKGQTRGCPLDSASTCTLFTPGYYAHGIDTTGITTAVFDPGIYYLDDDFLLKNSCIRPSNAQGTGSNDIGGTMFYFHAGTVHVDANAGNCPVAFDAEAVDGTGQLQHGIKCTSASQMPGNLPRDAGGHITITGNVLLGPCTGTYGDPLGTDDPIGEQRGMVFFENRSWKMPEPPPAKNAASWGGNGSSALIGTMYFHYCNSADGAEKGTRCSATAYTDWMSLDGNSGAQAFVAGEIVVDKYDMSGTPSLNMYLNPNALYYVLKATLLP